MFTSGLKFSWNGINCYVSRAQCIMAKTPKELGDAILYEIMKCMKENDVR